jgi:very-short-patch-repair endonuclease
MLPYNLNLKKRSQTLRKNSTDAEVLLWSFLKNKNLDDEKWYRQKPIGNYIVDFYCPKRKLVVEADGSQHFEEKGMEYDAERSIFLSSLGLKILRFDNYEILTNVDGVLERILEG